MSTVAPDPAKLVPVNLFGLDRDELSQLLQRYDAPRFRTDQIFRWMYERRQLSIADWTDLPRALRATLERDVVVDIGKIGKRTVSADRTVKYRTDLLAGGQVESVYMEQTGRVTLCISSQVGCALKCDFCLTARMGLVRHLSAGEILGQVALIERDRNLRERPFNIVFMGMGEPLHNYEAVMQAVRLLNSAEGFAISRKRITLSTSGLAPAIERLATESVRPRLAISLNATTDEVRDRLMPVNRKYPIERLVQACTRYTEFTGERISFEYVLLAGVNDSAEDLRRLKHLLGRVPAKLNLIPFNAVPGWLDYRPPSERHVRSLRDDLLDSGLRVSVRWSRGAAARAACGQLALLPEDARLSGSAEETSG